MNDLQSKLEQIKSNESWLEKIKRYIPGYDGYVNRDNSRELDTLLRNKLAVIMEANKTSLKNAVSALSDSGSLMSVSGLDKIDKKNETVIAKLKSAARGYSGAFDVIKVKEDKLNQLYQFDGSLLENAEDVCKKFRELEDKAKEKVDVKEIVSEISGSLDVFLNKFNEREEILKQ
ncbi:MAG TPA: hypothetical protein PK536_07850 [Ignavibacteria bacterium]|nr:hypothetical protein [Bacteroidota bacterium]HRI85346.1 hypothetical protein [Ignavibacteria bacterium]HRJ99632.1 hypothetical protein [Ignavibacteria bacterium]